MVHLRVKVTPVHLKSLDCHLINQEAGGKRIYKPSPLYLSKAGIPPGKSDASGRDPALLQHQGFRPDAARCVRFPRWNSSLWLRARGNPGFGKGWCMD